MGVRGPAYTLVVAGHGNGLLLAMQALAASEDNPMIMSGLPCLRSAPPSVRWACAAAQAAGADAEGLGAALLEAGAAIRGEALHAVSRGQAPQPKALSLKP